MKKALLLLPAIAVILSTIYACSKDDNPGGPVSVPPLPRGPQALVDQAIIEKYLETHFYNYEDFQNPTADFDFKIKFDTIAGDNADKTRLIDQVSFKTVEDREEDDVTYKLYYLSVIEGGGDPINFPDVATINFEGTWLQERAILDASGDSLKILELDRFDSAVSPIQFDLTQIVNGLQDALVEFKTATQIVENGDGTLSFVDYGVGAVFSPSGLGYYTVPPPGSGIPLYGELIFTFQTLSVQQGDQDNDLIPTIMEDRNGNGLEEDDDSDGDTIPDFLDNDDDNDFRITSEEIETNQYVLSPGDDEPELAENEVEVSRNVDDVSGVITINTIILTDEDGDGIPDYLDSDS